MDSAFYLHGLTDVVPEMVHVATARNSTRIKDARVRQYFMESALTAYLEAFVRRQTPGRAHPR